ncbi:hypothetical protein [Terriglobus sp. TAA 43]|uniref:hypothetical protein n=1 Tax=Terriglobus sp. TAA 43 TaxID=278961 RepID=UPI0018DE73DC|nr:hypothetical protein [Terriglobus sp. TAA 43]
MSFVHRGFVAALFGTVLLSCYAAKPEKAVVTELNTYLNRAHEAGLFNGVVLVTDHGKVTLR